MSDNRSLDEFARDEPSSDDQLERDDDGAAESGIEEGSDGADPGESDVEPMAETFAWSATGGSCENCGELVEERWRDDDGLVCADCKAW